MKPVFANVTLYHELRILVGPSTKAIQVLFFFLSHSSENALETTQSAKVMRGQVLIADTAKNWKSGQGSRLNLGGEAGFLQQFLEWDENT